MEYSPSSKADSFSLSQKTHKILWKPQVHHQGHISPPLVRILSQINRGYALFPSHFVISILHSLCRSKYSIKKLGFFLTIRGMLFVR